MRKGKFINRKYSWALALVILIVANRLVSLYPLRLDLTADKRYSLSPATKQLLAGLTAPVSVDVYLKGDFKSGYRKLANGTKELLNTFQQESKGKLRFQFIDPLAQLSGDSARALFLDSLSQLGLQPYTLVAQSKAGEEQTQRIVLPGAAVKSGEKQVLVNLLKGVSNSGEAELYNNAESLLEYKFAEAIEKVTQTATPPIAIATGNGEPLGYQAFDWLNTLALHYPIDTVNLQQVPAISTQFPLLIINKPNQTFSDAEKLKIDQFVLRGGKVLWLIDNLWAEMDSLQSGNRFIAYDRNLNIDDLLFKYGVRVNQNLVQDLQCATINLVVGMVGDKPQLQPLPWPYFPLLTGGEAHPISKNLDPVYGLFVNSIDTVESPGIQKTVLLQTSPNSRIIGTPVEVSFALAAQAENPKLFTQSAVPVAYLLEGNFESLYAARTGNTVADSFTKASGQPFLRKASQPGAQIVIADGDIALNEVTPRGPMQLGVSKDMQYTFANKDFLMNAVSYLLRPNGVLEARNKELTLRLLDVKKTEKEKQRHIWVNLLLPVLLVVLLGAILHRIRVQQFARN